MGIQLGDYVRFRDGQAPEALQGREHELGVVIALVIQEGSEPWPLAQFESYRSVASDSSSLRLVGGLSAARNRPEQAV